MNITVFGSGYVGLVVAACFAEIGHQVVCMDVDEQKIHQLQQSKVPFYEPGLEELVQRLQKTQHLRFTMDAREAVQHGDCQFIAVGTPSDAQGRADLSYVYAVARAIGEHMERPIMVVDKSTVPIGTATKVQEIIQFSQNQQQKIIPFDVVSNPEFLREGSAVKDFMEPDRIVLGVESARAEKMLRSLYEPFRHDESRFIVMDTRSAELTKYAANAMLATKISFMNEMANLAEKVGADIEKVRLGIGSDPRIGYHFTHAGCGYGGSCFGKDIQSLIHTTQAYACPGEIVQAVERVNARQKMHLFNKISLHYRGDLANKIFAIWGLAFKPETNDMRDAPSIVVINELLQAGARVRVYDPQAMSDAKKIFKQGNIHYCQHPEEAVEGANALVILTEWKIFRSPDYKMLKEKLIAPVIFDGRNIYDPILMAQMGFTYSGMGRGDNAALLATMEQHEFAALV